MTRCTVVNLKANDFDVYIGRAGHGWSGYFGNPFPLRVGEPRGATIERFRTYFLERVLKDPEFRRRALELRGLRLGCFCAPLPCHGDVIAAWVNTQFGGMRFSQRPYRHWQLREWECCGHLWQLLLTRAFPDRADWPGPICPTCEVSGLSLLTGFA